MSFTNNDTSIDISGCYIGFKDSGTGAPTSIRWCISNGSVLSNTTNIPSTGTDWCGTICIYPNTEETFNKLFSRYKIQVEIGNTISNYMSYKEGQSYPINLVGKNLFDGVYSKNYIDDSGSIISSTNTALTDFIRCSENVTISGTKDIYLVGVAFYDKNKGFISREQKADRNFRNITYNPPNNTNYIRVYINTAITNFTDEDLESFSIQVEKGSTATSYEEFWQIELAKISTYKDKIYKDSGKWYIHKENTKLVFKGGDEAWSTRPVSVGTLYEISTSTYGLYSTNNTTLGVSNQYTSNINLTNNNEFRILNGSTLTLHDDNIGSTTNLKTFLASNNLIIYYPLATATDTEITDSNLISQLEAVKLLSGTQNNFTIDADTLPTLNLNYIGEASPHL